MLLNKRRVQRRASQSNAIHFTASPLVTCDFKWQAGSQELPVISPSSRLHSDQETVSGDWMGWDGGKGGPILDVGAACWPY